MSIEFIGSLVSFATALIVNGLRWRWLIALVAAACCMEYGGNFGPFFSAFLLGVMLATRPKWTVTASWWPVAVLAVGVVLGGYTNEAGIYTYLRDLHPWLAKQDAMIVLRVVGAFLVMVAVLQSSKLQRAFSTRPLKVLGRISFSLYLTHQPIMYSLSAFIMLQTWSMKYHAAMAMSFCITAVVCMGVAYAMSETIDRWAISMSRRAAKFLVADEPPLAAREVS